MRIYSIVVCRDEEENITGLQFILSKISLLTYTYDRATNFVTETYALDPIGKVEGS